MPKPSHEHIARVEERRQALSLAAVAACAEPIAGGFMCFEGDGSSANLAIGLGLEGPVSDGEIERLVAFFTARGVEPRVDVCPFAHETLMRGLVRRGFALREIASVLARAIDPEEDLRALLPHGWPGGLTVARVDPGDAAEVQAYVEVSTSGFRHEGQPDEPLAALTRRVVARPGCDAYLALVGGEPAGGGGIEVSGGAAGLFGASVLPRFRERGVQQALIVRRLERARELGCSFACVEARPGVPTERNAARLGFFLAYSKCVLTIRGESPRPSRRGGAGG